MAKASLLPAYLAVGADELKSREVQTRLKGRLEKGLEAFNLDERVAGPDMTAGDLVASLNTIPMGSGFRLVLVTRAEKLPKPVSEAIVTYLKNPNPGCTLLLVATSLAKSTRLYKAVKAVGPHAIIDCAPVKRWQLAPRVVRMATRYGLRMDERAAAELVSRVGESTTMIDAQLRTLAAQCRDSGEATVADVERIVARTAEVKPWDFLDAVCDRDATKALSLYRLMQNPSQIALTSLLCGRLRELVCARSLATRGQGGMLAQELGKQQWQVKNHLRWARRFADGELEACLGRAAACERGLKSGDDPESTFLSLVMAVCGRGATA